MTAKIETQEFKAPEYSGNRSEWLSECFGAKIVHFSDRTFPQLFEEQVASGGTGSRRTAVVSGNHELSYAELNNRANQLARYLRGRGVGAETIVGICVERSLDMAVGILGILKSGAAYLPLDPEYPADRLSWMVSDSNVLCVLTTENLAARVPHSCQRIFLDAERPQIAEELSDNLQHGPGPLDLAYVIYTSGSTGIPKGVMINHGSLANYVLALQHELGITERDRYLHTASIAFSSSRRQLLLPLSQGATVAIASSDQRKDPLALFTLIKATGITVMDAVPSFWRNCTTLLSSLDPEIRIPLLDNNLRLMLSASEPLMSDIHHTWTHEFGHRAQHVHMFGQTETAGIVCTYKMPSTDKHSQPQARAVPIGRPIANTDIYILDEMQQPVAVGTPGELYIGGAGVGRGYLNQPGLTAARFVAHPFSDNPGARLYRTGDWARFSVDGQLEFAGRHDSQVKVRGFRIELGEVEAALASHPDVKDNAVVARKDASGAMRLIAYVVSDGATTPQIELRAFLAAQLPDYMVPAKFLQLPALPLNANGKVDRLRLPEPEDLRPQLATTYEAPRTAREELVAEVWREVLQLEQIGVNDNFLELGGHSLMAIQIIARINDRLGCALPLRQLFDGPTIGLMARAIEGSGTNGTPARLLATRIARVNRDHEIPLSFAQQRLWFIEQLEPGRSLYNINRALRLRGPLDVTKLGQAIQSIASRHEILRTTFSAQDGRPAQRIAPSVTLPFNLHELLSVPEPVREAEALRIINNESKKLFDLARGPLARVTLVRIAPEEHLLLLSIHHIIADAWAVQIFFQELAAFYHNPAAALGELEIQYADFSHWQHRALSGHDLDAQLAYWKRQLEGAPLATDLPTDFPRAAVPGYAGAQQTSALPANLSEALRELSRQEDVTLFMTMLTAFQIMLAHYSRRDTIVVGVPVAGRTLVETDSLIGCFVNTLVLRGDMGGDPTVRELLKRSREVALGAYSNQEMPFERLVEELQPERNLNRNPLFSAMFTLQNKRQSPLSLYGMTAEVAPIELSSSKFDLSLDVVEKAEALDVSLSYTKELFDPVSIDLMLEDYQLVLGWMVAGTAQQPLSQLPKLRWTPGVRPVEATAEPQTEFERQETEFLAPRTPIEERLTQIWKTVLKVEQLGMHDNFFGLGGHSLLAAQVISRTRNTFSVDLPLRQIFESPTVAGLAGAIYELQTAETEDGDLAAILSELSQISDEEAQRQFAEEL